MLAFLTTIYIYIYIYISLCVLERDREIRAYAHSRKDAPGRVKRNSNLFELIVRVVRVLDGPSTE